MAAGNCAKIWSSRGKNGLRLFFAQLGLGVARGEQVAVRLRVAGDGCSSVFNWRSVRWRCCFAAGRRVPALLAMASLYMALKNRSGSCGMRCFSPARRISPVAFISGRAASRNKTQSTGKWMLALRQVLSKNVSEASTGGNSCQGCGAVAVAGLTAWAMTMRRRGQLRSP